MRSDRHTLFRFQFLTATCQHLGVAEETLPRESLKSRGIEMREPMLDQLTPLPLASLLYKLDQSHLKRSSRSVKVVQIPTPTLPPPRGRNTPGGSRRRDRRLEARLPGIIPSLC